MIYWTYPIWKSAMVQSAAAAAVDPPAPRLRRETGVVRAVGWSDTDWRGRWQQPYRQLITCVPWWTDTREITFPTREKSVPVICDLRCEFLKQWPQAVTDKYNKQNSFLVQPPSLSYVARWLGYARIRKKLLCWCRRNTETILSWLMIRTN